MKIVIRKGRPEDALVLSELAARTFRETFDADNRPDDMALYIASAYGISQQTTELLDPQVVTLLAEIDGQNAGYAMLRSAVPPACVTGDDPIELWRFYITREWHGRGVAQRLFHDAEVEAYRRGGRTLWLGVWERNERAKAFYLKNGFSDVGSQVFIVGTDAQTDRVMVRPIAGEVRRFYHGTRAELKPGDLVHPGYASNYTERKSPWVYFTETLQAATWGAELAKGEGRPRIYQVQPTGSFVDDPNLTDKKFPGNPTRSFRSQEPLRVVGEYLDWTGHSPEQIQTMKDGIAGKEPIDD